MYYTRKLPIILSCCVSLKNPSIYPSIHLSFYPSINILIYQFIIHLIVVSLSANFIIFNSPIVFILYIKEKRERKNPSPPCATHRLTTRLYYPMNQHHQPLFLSLRMVLLQQDLHLYLYLYLY